MRLDFAFICDYAELTGKINALGIGFDTIYTPQVPFSHPSFFLVMQVRASVVEAGEKTLEVRLIDEDGKDVIPTVKGKYTVPQSGVGTDRIGRIALALQNVRFPHYGSYSLHAVVDGQEMFDISLKISPPPQGK